MLDNISSNRLFRIAGGLILLGSCWFLASRFLQVWHQLPEIEISKAIWGGCAIAVVAYALILILLSLAWWQLLIMLGPQSDPGFPEVFRVFMRTQIAKYLPGNVFQYLGRIELMKQSGVSRMHTGLSLTYESILLLAVAVILGGGPILSLGFAKGVWLKHAMWWIGAGAGGMLFFLWVAHHWRPGVLRHLPEKHQSGWKMLVKATILYGIFFFLFSGILWGLAGLFGHSVPYGVCLAAICLPWAAGFVTPGSPGGIGVREAMMVLILSQVMPPMESLIIPVFLRMATIIGDLAAFFLSYAVSHPIRE